MGGIKLFSSSSYDGTPVAKPPMPDPNNFEVVTSLQVGAYSVVEVRYPDCTNYEGLKIMVYKATLDDLLLQGHLDPHFAESTEFLSPVARFEPTAAGWTMAMHFLHIQATGEN